MDERALIEELDTRQNDVIDRLAELNARVEALLNECLAARDEALKAAELTGPHAARKVTHDGPDAPTSQSPSATATPKGR